MEGARCDLAAREKIASASPCRHTARMDCLSTQRLIHRTDVLIDRFDSQSQLGASSDVHVLLSATGLRVEYFAERFGHEHFRADSTEGRQYLVYSMTLKADAELAMILPLPVPWKIEASFVPTIADFDRLDERFRLPKETWHHLPQYNKFGFAVFKLKPGEKRIHPMAFEFPRSDSKRLFFPTVHIHDGEVHATADFDHILYCQQNPDEHFRAPASRFMRIDATKGIVAADSHCYMRRMTGKLKNEDNYV